MNRQEMIETVYEGFRSGYRRGVSGHALAEHVTDEILARQGDDTAEFRVRRAAPDTSKAIVDSIRRGSLQEAVLDLFDQHLDDGYTDDHLEQVMGRAHQSVSATRNTLVRKGYLVDSGRVERNRWGNEAIVWVRTGKRVAQ